MKSSDKKQRFCLQFQFATLPAAVVALLIATWLGTPELHAASRRPNVVFILTDNHRAWTLGCYGNKDIRTPHIDRFAQEGTLFTNCFSSNAVCSPTRATYLTGLMPSQHGVHCYLHGGRAQVGPQAYNMIREFRTIPRIFAEQGYACGMTGKWHLGDNAKPQEGFTTWITTPHGHTTTFYDAEIIEDGKIRKEPQYLTEFWTDHAVKFIEDNKERPFFLYVPYNGPYGLGGLLNKPARNRHATYYEGKELLSFPREPVHNWLLGNRQFVNNINAMRRYAAEVSGIDDGVGRIMETLKKLELDENTLVIFTADQGLCGGHNGMWGMGDHSRPLHAYDGTMHIPLIWRHPKRIAPGQRSDIMLSNYDFYRTLLTYLGWENKIPATPRSPGRDYSTVLRGEPVKEWDDVIFYEFENTRSIRTKEWKYTRRVPDGPNELYHLAVDPGERINLVLDPVHEPQRQRLGARLDAFFDEYADPKYDLWKNGGSKTLLCAMKERPAIPLPAAEDSSQPASK